MELALLFSGGTHCRGSGLVQRPKAAVTNTVYTLNIKGCAFLTIREQVFVRKTLTRQAVSTAKMAMEGIHPTMGESSAMPEQEDSMRQEHDCIFCKITRDNAKATRPHPS